jgi:RimJ/RimL family protein N-acetyltransferase
MTAPAITLRPVGDADLPFLFAIQTIARVIDADGEPAGLVLSFGRDGVRELGYWIDRSKWGRGIATAAVAAFLPLDPHRPLVAKVLKDNFGSLRVVERNGFVRTGERTEGGWHRAGEVGLWGLVLNTMPNPPTAAGGYSGT